MDMSSFFKGVVIGFSIAAPVGPIGLLCIRRTLADGRAMGLATGLGAAAADGVYGLIAGLGLTAVARFLIGVQGALGLVGGLFLCYMGYKTFISRPAEEAANMGEAGSLWRAFGSTFLLTMTNPMTILSFTAIFAGLGLAKGAGAGGAVPMVLGVFLGSAAWWLLLTTGISLFRHRVDGQTLRWINRIAGGVLVACGVLAALSPWMPH
jgi:threonine/homoserine/homoserine lactone efflux protein